jgi:hypothetical protein
LLQYLTLKPDLIFKNKKGEVLKLRLESVLVSIEKDLMTDKTLTYFRKNLDDNLITLSDIKSNDKYINKIRRIIQIIAYDINKKTELPQSYQRIINSLIKNK